MARTEDLTIVEGADATIKVFIVDTNGAAKDINNKLFSGGMKKTYSDPTTISFSTAVVDANGGVIQLSLNSTQTSTLDTSVRYVYDVVMYESGNTNIERIMDGKVFIKPSVTILGS